MLGIHSLTASLNLLNDLSTSTSWAGMNVPDLLIENGMVEIRHLQNVHHDMTINTMRAKVDAVGPGAEVWKWKREREMGAIAEKPIRRSTCVFPHPYFPDIELGESGISQKNAKQGRQKRRGSKRKRKFDRSPN